MRTQPLIRTVTYGLLALPSIVAGQEAGDRAGVDFAREIEPIFAARCVECHGPDKQKFGLRLDRRGPAMLGGDSGEPGIVPGASARSEVFRRIVADDDLDRMPPSGPPLTGEETLLIQRWIDEGAAWSNDAADAADDAEMQGAEHWSLQPISDPAPPRAGDPWGASPIDAFVLARLQQEGLEPSPEADRVTLIRRLYLDLHGLLPTPAQVNEFDQDDEPDAWERLVERALASPRYGERWAQHWLDAVQYADTHGFEMNNPRPSAFHYRDYVIGAFNSDLPYDRFVFEQLAGDTVGVDAATGFLVAGAWDQVVSQEPAYTMLQRQDELTAMVNTTGTAFLGLTLGCARCHNHKFDPVSQREFYSMTAVFAGVRHGERALGGPGAARILSQRAEIAAEAAALRAELPSLRPAARADQNEERFEPRSARSVRMSIHATSDGAEPCIDELEVWAGDTNVALGAKPSSSGDYAGNPKHRLEHVSDGQYGNDHSWISDQSGRGWIQLDLPEPALIDRVSWGRDRSKMYGDRTAIHYTIEVSETPDVWVQVSGSQDRLPFGQSGGDDASFAARPELVQGLAGLEERARELDVSALPAVYAGRLEQPGPTHRLYRGDVLQRREAVAPDTLAVLGSLQLAADAPEGERRVALARSITAPGNPLTARVMANRVWHHHFGAGIVTTPGDFGANGATPSHPGLLDWLAGQFVRDGWSVKQLHRAILGSKTYRQASRPSEAGLARDADARLLWRFPPRRLEAEVLRDCILQLSESLDLTMGGPGFSTFEPNENYVRVYAPKEVTGPAEWRRMVYRHKVRMEREPLFGAFDLPDAGQVCAKRSRSTTAIQALNLFNGPFVLDHALRMAAWLQVPGNDPAKDPIEAVYRRAYSRSPNEGEASAARRFIEQYGLAPFCRAIFNSNELVFLP